MWPLFSHLEGLIKRMDALCGNIISIIFLTMVSIFALRQEDLVTHPSRHPALPERHTIPHIPAIWADHGVSEPLNGLATDAVGLGPDGGLWGGGLLRLAGVKCDRLAHLRPLRLPLGDGTGGTGCRARTPFCSKAPIPALAPRCSTRRLPPALPNGCMFAPQGHFQRGAVDREKEPKIAVGGGCVRNID